jgi:Tfp pilus assembly protein PilX
LNRTPCDGITASGPVRCLKEERGVALIVVLVMLMLLSILGATMLVSSTSELKIAGSYRNSAETFAGAESALVFGRTFSDIYNNLSYSVTVWPALPSNPLNGGQGVIYNADLTVKGPNTGSGHDPYSNQIPILDSAGQPTGVTADVKVQLVGTGNVPPGSGTQSESGISPGSGNFKANTYAIDVTAFGKNKNNTRVQLESEVARIVQQ